MRLGAMILLMTLLGASATLAGQTRDENWKRCLDSNPDLSIGGCTALIQAGQENDSNLAKAFRNRGIAYDDKGEYDRAIQDYDQSIRINPNFADAYSSRGSAYDDKGDYDRALQDYAQALPRLE